MTFYTNQVLGSTIIVGDIIVVEDEFKIINVGKVVYIFKNKTFIDYKTTTGLKFTHVKHVILKTNNKNTEKILKLLYE